MSATARFTRRRGGCSSRALIAYDGDALLEVRDRAALERVSCECYGVVRDEYERLLAPGTSG